MSRAIILIEASEVKCITKHGAHSELGDSALGLSLSDKMTDLY